MHYNVAGRLDHLHRAIAAGQSHTRPARIVAHIVRRMEAEIHGLHRGQQLSAVPELDESVGVTRGDARALLIDRGAIHRVLMPDDRLAAHALWMCESACESVCLSGHGNPLPFSRPTDIQSCRPTPSTGCCCSRGTARCSPSQSGRARSIGVAGSSGPRLSRFCRGSPLR